MEVSLSPKSYSQNADKLLQCYMLVAPLSLGLAEFFVVAVVLFWLLSLLFRPESTASEEDAKILKSDDRREGAYSLYRRVVHALAAAAAMWFAVCVFSSLVGIDPLSAAAETRNSAFYLLLPFAVAASFSDGGLSLKESLERIVLYFLLLFLGQSVAALHSVFSVSLHRELPLSIPGPVTESGQLVLVLPCLAALLLSQAPLIGAKREAIISPAFVAVSALLSFFGLLIAWPEVFFLPRSAAALIRGMAALSFLASALWLFRIRLRWLPRTAASLAGMPSYAFSLFLWITGSLIATSLLINLKRGPWLGAVTALILLGLFYSRRLALWTFLLSLAAVATLSPARDRVESFSDHFAIDGGRQYMWSLGVELAARFPLGLGPDNAKFIKVLDPKLPSTHSHLHSNPLNVLVETGWIGLAVYLCWMYAVIRIGFLVRRDLASSSSASAGQVAVLAVGISSALLGWQLAGLVEYNFGDGEVQLLAYFLMGISLALARMSGQIRPD